MPPKKPNLGKSLVKDRFKGKRKRRVGGDESSRHTTEVGDGYDWNKINLRSVTEETSIDEFLNTAQLAGTEFVAEKLNITFVNPKGQIGIPSAEELHKIKELQRENIALLQIPRRPAWDETTSAAELHAAEELAFLEWRRQLAQLQEARDLTLTPYERNLEFWRQLWRVVERSDVVVQILDARNPLLYRCEDLERYVREVDPEKDNLLLINKSDLLTAEQRAAWADYFNETGIKAAFFSALNEADAPPATIAEEPEEPTEDSEGEGESSEKEEAESDSGEEGSVSEGRADGPPPLSAWPAASDQSESTDVAEDASEPTGDGTDDGGGGGGGFTSPRLLPREELIALLKTVHAGRRRTEGVATIGFVGYPNVGKSSTINALLQAKKVSVSATPGKTKHFQTLHIDSELILCDCPGLVMPSFLSTKAEMVVWGVLPIDQMRDHVPPVNLVAHLIPRPVLERTYGLMLPLPREGEQPDRPPTAEELLNAYGYMRGFMTARGLPDNPRSARVILKDFVRGKLLYCLAPPGRDQEQFNKWPLEAPRERAAGQRPPQEKMVKPNKPTADAVDSSFFSAVQSKAHSRDHLGVQRVDGRASAVPVSDEPVSESASTTSTTKPWRVKGGKRPKKGKLRRVYRHLDDV
ncbi:large subunit GTPase 1 homolog [Amphibalanus amphitrite]|uniref:large subunit GTPase 1 homolog n=1 Tax=Amphibalanus amphitrite TaxID=1232801 RepID=UPI001C924DAA|nr:large subunit GTPase 1 homolog [Amphibalanus amphitrite]